MNLNEKKMKVQRLAEEGREQLRSLEQQLQLQLSWKQLLDVPRVGRSSHGKELWALVCLS